MTLSAETLLIVSLMMAVFAAVSTVGTSLFLGAGFERLRAGFETIKKQTAFFSDAIHTLDKRVDTVEKQGNYFFEAITNLEQTTIKPVEQPHDVEDSLIHAGRSDTMMATADSLLNARGFVQEPVPQLRKSLSEEFVKEAAAIDRHVQFH